MALCDKITSGHSRGCRTSSPGVYTIFIASYPDDMISPFDWDGVSGSGYAKLNTSGNTIEDFDELKIQFYEFKPEKGSGTFNETSNTEPTNGTTAYAQSVVFNMAGLSPELRDQVKILTQGDAVIIVKDKNNNYAAFGVNDGIILTTNTAQAGLGGTDLSGNALEFTTEEGDPFYFVDEAAVLASVVS